MIRVTIANINWNGMNERARRWRSNRKRADPFRSIHNQKIRSAHWSVNFCSCSVHALLFSLKANWKTPSIHSKSTRFQINDSLTTKKEKHVNRRLLCVQCQSILQSYWSICRCYCILFDRSCANFTTWPINSYQMLFRCDYSIMRKKIAPNSS